ncbi:hypothetical protein HJC23_003336 [Cyclotella cryptica]|uniref:Short-chain dehydrogenase/reductase SDR n=1 Tax=Cyclotella cryptica TaxID=29204 RepID=A0ABD3QY27_9STRA
MNRSAKIFTSRRTQQTCLSSTSAFQAPEPPQSHGQPVFPDVHIRNDAATEGTNAFLRNDDSDAVFVVNGSSRGIGLQFVQTLTQRTRGKIVACCRSPATARDLQTIASAHQHRIQILPLDMEQQSTIDDVAYKIATEYRRVDALFNVVGILGDGVTTPGPERTLAAMERDWLQKSLEVNVIGPLMLTKALSPLMRTTGTKVIRLSNRNASGESEQLQINLPHGRPPTVVASLSARVGSISDNRLGGWYSYRLSKAALNQATKTLALELKRQGTWIVALHPGTTDTDLSKPFQKNVQKERLFPVDFTVNSLMDVVESLDDPHSGGFFDWAGKAIPF